MNSFQKKSGSYKRIDSKKLVLMINSSRVDKTRETYWVGASKRIWRESIC